MDSEQQQLRKYLLGELPEEEAARLDERLFTGDEFLRELEAEQELLIEEFASRRLSPEEESSFRKQCSRSPELLGQVNEVQILLAALRKRATAKHHAKNNWFQQRIFVFLSPVLAAALCVAIWLYWNQHQANSALRRQLDSAASEPSPPPAVVQPLPGGQQLVAFLAANVVRGSASLPTIKVPDAVTTIELQVEIRGSEPAAEWNVSISQDSKPVWMSARVPLRSFGSTRFLDAHVDASLLQPGEYSMRIIPVQGTQIAQTRQFVVIKTK